MFKNTTTKTETEFNAYELTSRMNQLLKARYYFIDEALVNSHIPDHNLMLTTIPDDRYNRNSGCLRECLTVILFFHDEDVYTRNIGEMFWFIELHSQLPVDGQHIFKERGLRYPLSKIDFRVLKWFINKRQIIHRMYRMNGKFEADPYVIKYRGFDKKIFISKRLLSTIALYNVLLYYLIDRRDNYNDYTEEYLDELFSGEDDEIHGIIEEERKGHKHEDAFEKEIEVILEMINKSNMDIYRHGALYVPNVFNVRRLNGAHRDLVPIFCPEDIILKYAEVDGFGCAIPEIIQRHKYMTLSSGRVINYFDYVNEIEKELNAILGRLTFEEVVMFLDNRHAY